MARDERTGGPFYRTTVIAVGLFAIAFGLLALLVEDEELRVSILFIIGGLGFLGFSRRLAEAVTQYLARPQSRISTPLRRQLVTVLYQGVGLASLLTGIASLVARLIQGPS